MNPLDAVVARMHREDGTGLFAEGVLVVGPMGPVGRADLAQARPAGGDDVGHAESAPDLDQLAPGDDHLAAAGETVEQQQHGGGVVVDHNRGFGAAGVADHPLDMGEPRSPLTGFQVDFEIAVVLPDLYHRRQGRRGQRSPPQTGVQDDPCRVDDAMEARLAAGEQRSCELGLHPRQQLFPGRNLASGRFQQLAANPAQHRAHRLDHVAPVAGARQPARRLEPQHLVDRRERFQRVVHSN